LAKRNFFGIKAAKNGDIFVTIGAENMIAKISQSGVLTPVNVNINLGLQGPADLAIAPDNTLYIADTGHNRIVKVTPDGTASVLAGRGVPGLADGAGNEAKFNHITTIKLSSDGYLWVIDGNVPRPNKSVRRVTLQGVVKTIKLIPFVYGDDDIQNTVINDLAIAKRDKNFNRSSGTSLFLAYGIAKLTHMSTTGVETPISRNSMYGVVDGAIDTAQFAGASGICINDNKMYIVDHDSYLIRRVIKKE
jgi:sugar lactone lactonase YvrE